MRSAFAAGLAPTQSEAHLDPRGASGAEGTCRLAAWRGLWLDSPMAEAHQRERAALSSRCCQPFRKMGSTWR